MTGWWDRTKQEMYQGWLDVRWQVRFALWLLPCIAAAAGIGYMITGRWSNPPVAVDWVLGFLAALLALYLAKPWQV